MAIKKFFENINNKILVLFKNCFCSLSLVFFVFFVFFIIKRKKIRTKHAFHVFFSIFLRLKKMF